MKIKAALILVMLSNLPMTEAWAQDDGKSLSTSKMCYACHQMEAVSLGPPWRAIAARHGSRREVMTEVLAGKIIHGGGGNWGQVPMVPNQRVTREEARILATWILEQAEIDN